MHNKFFAIGLALSFAFTGGFIGWQQVQLNMRNGAALAEMEAAASQEAEQNIPLETETRVTTAAINDSNEPSGIDNLTVAESDPVASSEASSEVSADISTGSSEEEPVEEVHEETAEEAASDPPKAEFTNVDTSYFSDALFIGDSRMVGIKEYGGLKEPTYFASTGMSSFKLYKESLEVNRIGEISFEALISSRTFGKVYLMLGINEAGCKLPEFQNQYNKIVADIRDKQPDAVLFLCSNLHVTKYKSEHDSIFANSHIDEINKVIENTALKYGGYYLDVNPIFDDGEGNLSTEFAADYAHMYGRCYLTWIDWLCTKGIYVKKYTDIGIECAK